MNEMTVSLYHVNETEIQYAFIRTNFKVDS